MFPSAPAALAATASAQRGLADHDWGDGTTLLVRMGLHTGERRPRGDRRASREVMDESQVMAGWEERRAMTMEQALAYVRHGEPRHGPKASSAADG